MGELQLPHISAIGHNYAGKSDFCDYVVQKYPFYEKVTTGHLWDFYALKNGLIKDGETLSHYQRTVIGRQAVAQHGEKIMTEMLQEKLEMLMQKDTKRKFLIDGVRHEDSINFLRSYLKDIAFVGIIADVNVRLQRALSRGESEETFYRREEEDGKYFRLDELIEKFCDIKILNNIDNKNLYHQEIDKVVGKLKSQEPKI